MKPKDNRHKAIAQINIAKGQMAMDEDTYRAMLANITGKNSLRAMSLAELYKVVHHLQALGFNKRPRNQRYSPKARGLIIDVLRALWIQMHQAGIVSDGSEHALSQWAKRASSQRNGGIGVDNLEWLERNPRLAGQVVEDLKQWQRRVMRVWKQDDVTTVQHACRNHPALSKEQIIKHLLEQRRIFWWRDFEDMGLPDSPHYCKNRQEINRGL